MSLSYNGTEPQSITYNGADVQTVTYNGVEVWSGYKPIGICLVQTGGGNGVWTRVYDGGSLVDPPTPETTEGTAVGIVMTATGGGSGQWQRINQDNVAV